MTNLLKSPILERNGEGSLIIGAGNRRIAVSGEVAARIKV